MEGRFSLDRSKTGLLHDLLLDTRNEHLFLNSCLDQKIGVTGQRKLASVVTLVPLDQFSISNKHFKGFFEYEENPKYDANPISRTIAK